MKIKESTLRRIIKEELIVEFFSSNSKINKEIENQNMEFTGGKKGKPEINTIGDLKKLVTAATNKKKDAVRGAGVKDAAVGLLADLLPGGGTIKDLAGAAIAAYKLPDEAQSQTGLDHLNVDDNLSKIVSDEVENAFLKALGKKLAGMPEKTPLQNVKMNALLSKFIASKFNKRTVTGFDAE